MAGILYNEKKKDLISILVIMTAASLSVVLPLTILKNVAATFILYHLGFCLLLPIIHLVFFRMLDFRAFLGFLGINGGDMGKSVLLGVVHGLSFLAFTIVGYFMFQNAPFLANINTILSQWGVFNDNKWAVVVFMIIFNGMAEEIFWRGYAQKRLQASVKPQSAIIVTTIFYTSYHLVTTISFFHFNIICAGIVLTIFCAGLLWGWMRWRFDSLWAPVIGHVCRFIIHIDLRFSLKLHEDHSEMLSQFV